MVQRTGAYAGLGFTSQGYAVCIALAFSFTGKARTQGEKDHDGYVAVLLAFFVVQ